LAEELMAAARVQTGIPEIIDSEIREPLEHLLVSLNTEAELSEAGVDGIQTLIMRVLRNRLRMERDLRRHPEIGDQQIVRPLILTGGPRSGTTKLHKMLAASGDFIVLLCWQGMCPALRSGERDEDPTERIREADDRVRWFNEHAPKARLIHELSTFEVEEENLIFEHRFWAPYLAPWLNVPGYVAWYMGNNDFRGELSYLKRTLQYLQWQFHDGDPRPWLLKSPAYPGYEPLLREVFPDATFAATHRDPLQVMGSGNSLIASFQAAYSDADRKANIGPGLLEGLSTTWNNHMAARESHPEISILDIGYPDMSNHAEQVVERVYAHAGLPLSDRAREVMRTWELANRQHKHGAHTYSLDDFGVTPEAIRERMQRYIARFGAYWS
jgi:hypothetical protein